MVTITLYDNSKQCHFGGVRYCQVRVQKLGEKVVPFFQDKNLFCCSKSTCNINFTFFQYDWHLCDCYGSTIYIHRYTGSLYTRVLYWSNYFHPRYVQLSLVRIQKARSAAISSEYSDSFISSQFTFWILFYNSCLRMLDNIKNYQ